MKTGLFQSFGHCWVFQICCHIECSTFTASSFRIWNSSTGIPSPPLALLIVMLPKAHLTLHSRMSGFRWVITPLWLSGSWKSFLYSSSVYSCHLFLISSASTRSIPLLPIIVLIFAWNIPLVSLIFLKKSLVFPILLFSSISLHWSLKKAFLSLLAFLGTRHSNGYIFPILLCLSLLFFSQLFVRPRRTTILPFCISFSWGWSWSLPLVQCHKPLSIVLRALCLSDLICGIYLSLPLYNCKGFDLGHTWMVLTVINLSLNFAIRSSWSKPQSAPAWSCFCWLHSQRKSLKCSTCVQSQKWQNDLCLFPRQTIQYHNNPSLCPNQ